MYIDWYQNMQYSKTSSYFKLKTSLCAGILNTLHKWTKQNEGT